MKNKTYRCHTFYQENQQKLRLKLWSDEATLAKELSTDELNRPGLALTGFLNRFGQNRVQIVGETEYAYLTELTSDLRKERIKNLFEYNIAAFFFSKNLEPQTELIELCNENNIPLFSSGLTTQMLMFDLKRILDVYFAKRIHKHGTLVDVYGVGLMLVGDSGVGKSECALDLVERGHRLVTDDNVVIHRDIGFLIGEQQEPIRHIMEIHGIGFVDVNALFGIRATRRRKRIEIVVAFEQWQKEKFYNRTGLDKEFIEILDVMVPKITVPVNSGKNMAVICEVIALDYMLKNQGINVAEEFNERIKNYLQNKNKQTSNVYVGDTE